VTVEANTLRVSGKSQKDEEKKNVHLGIARHSFERRFSLSIRACRQLATLAHIYQRFYQRFGRARP